MIPPLRIHLPVLAVRGLPDPDMTGLHKKNKSDDGQSSESGSSHPHAPGSQSSGKDTTGQEDMGKEKGKDTEKDKEAEAPPKNEERAEQLGKVDEAQKEVQNAIEESQHGSEDAALFEESDGEYMNLEVKFAYRARKSDSHSTASRVSSFSVSGPVAREPS